MAEQAVAQTPLGEGELKYRGRVVTGTSTNLDWGESERPCPDGHVVAGGVIEYVDGAVVGECANCRERIYLPSVPGGLSLIRTKALVEKLMLMRDPMTRPEIGGSVTGYMQELSDLIIAHAHDHVKLNESGKLLEIAKSLIKQLEPDA